MYSLRFDMRTAPDGVAASELFRTALDMCEWSESRGALAVSLAEHHMDTAGYLPSPLIMASAIAGRTTRMTIAVAIFQLPLYNPVRLAEEMCVLDNLSLGRVRFVGGIGYIPYEYTMHGVDYHRRGKIADEYLGLVLKAVTGEEFEYEGRRIKVTPGPYTPGGPSIAWGGGSVAALRRAGKYGLEVIAQRSDPELVAAYEEACREYGHTPASVVMNSDDDAAVQFVADDVDAAWEEIGPYMLNDVRGYAQWYQKGTDSNSISFAESWQELRAENRSHVILTVAEAVEQVRSGEPLKLHPLIGGLPPEIGWRYLRTVAEKVMAYPD